MKILVTGANGFVGTALRKRLLSCGVEVHAATRATSHPFTSTASISHFVVGELDQNTDWMSALTGVDAVIHLAARVHILNEQIPDPLSEFVKVNVEGTANLARQAATSGVKRFVYLSSIKVNGESTSIDIPFRETDPPSPQDPYAISKLRAEEVLHQISADTGMESVIVRPPLVYGPGVKANFAKLLSSVDKGIPLPFGCVVNKRSLVFVDNICDALLQCATHPAAAGHTYLVSDGPALSTPELVRSIASALNRPARLIPVPLILMRTAASLTGKTSMVDRLLQSLVVDSSRIRNDLGWNPPYTITQGLQVTADWFRAQQDGQRCL